MAKKLIVNCATCDARNLRQEDYAHYEAITVNSAVLLTSPEGKAAMNQLPFALNCANVAEVEKGVDLRMVNGRHEISSSDTVSPSKFYLVVNGALIIGPDTRRQLEPCVGVAVNGSLTCPESMYAALNGVTVNGSTTCYPDGAIVLKPSAVIDKLFALRAKNSLYWSAKRLIMVDPELCGAALRDKGASFRAREVIIAQSKVEELIDLIDEQAQLIIVPDHTAVVTDDLTLDEEAVGRWGRKLYVIGDVTVPEQGTAPEGLEYLNVQGDIWVPREKREALLSVLTEISGEVKTLLPKGALLRDKPYVKLTRWMLEQHSTGLQVSDCAVVQLADDIPKEWIVERLRIEDCAVVRCSAELEDAVAMVSEDVGEIGRPGPEDEDTAGNSIKAALGSLKGALDTKVINAAQYVL